METLELVSALVNFLKQTGDQHIESTSATVTTYSGVLYNVDGSTPDPKIGGKSWKDLLIYKGITGPNCYVTNPGAGGSHPDFSVGGHMTTNSDGSVPTGGSCYLMPLCYFHNSTSKNGIAFSHTQTSMLLLSGYMQSDLAATFMARMHSTSPFSIVYLSDAGLETQNLPESAMVDTTALQLQNTAPGKLPGNHIVFRRKEIDGRSVWVVDRFGFSG